MNDYRSYDRIENFNKYSAQKLFEVQLESVGSIIKINNKVTKGIITNEINPYAENKEDRTLKVWENEELKKGDYIEYGNEVYLVISDIDIYTDKNYAFKDCKIRKCNQIIHMPNDISIYAIVEGESYGVKLIGSSDYFSEADTKVRVTVGDNEINRKYLGLNSRFCFGNSEHGIYKNADISVYQKGLLVNICKKDDYLKGLDDLNTGVMYQGNTENIPDMPEEPTNYEIVGQDTVKINSEYTYTISPSNIDAIFSLVEYSEGTAEIINQSNGNCTVKVVKSDEVITLSASVSEKVVATIDILTVRR